MLGFRDSYGVGRPGLLPSSRPKRTRSSAAAARPGKHAQAVTLQLDLHDSDNRSGDIDCALRGIIDEVIAKTAGLVEIYSPPSGPVPAAFGDLAEPLLIVAQGAEQFLGGGLDVVVGV